MDGWIVSYLMSLYQLERLLSVECERMIKFVHLEYSTEELVMAHFNEPSWHSPALTDEIH
jgi:hypothetical protein